MLAVTEIVEKKNNVLNHRKMLPLTTIQLNEQPQKHPFYRKNCEMDPLDYPGHKSNSFLHNFYLAVVCLNLDRYVSSVAWHLQLSKLECNISDSKFMEEVLFRKQVL